MKIRKKTYLCKTCILGFCLLHCVVSEKKTCSSNTNAIHVRQSYSVPQLIVIYIFIYLFSLNCVVRQDHILLVTLLKCIVPGFLCFFVSMG